MASVDDVRRLCLALPEVTERPYHHVMEYLVRGRMFANTRSIGVRHLAAGIPVDQPVAPIKLYRDDQLALIEVHPDILKPHRYFAKHGWVVALLEQVDEPLLAMLLRLSWATIAPKTLLERAGLNSGGV